MVTPGKTCECERRRKHLPVLSKSLMTYMAAWQLNTSIPPADGDNVCVFRCSGADRRGETVELTLMVRL